MARQIVDISTVQANGKRGEPAPSAFAKLNANDGELYTLVGVGGIVDSGSNSNGSYVKYAEGTMECRVRLDPGLVASQGALAFVWTFPLAFTDPPIISGMMCTSGGYGYTMSMGGDTPANNDRFVASAINRSSESRYAVVYLKATGRWK